MEAPILALQAGDDARITPYWNRLYVAALEIAGVDHELVTYDGAPHSFFDRKQEEFADASADAWRRTLEFIERHAD
jgi:carboxymethylenebutenolidase